MTATLPADLSAALAQRFQRHIDYPTPLAMELALRPDFNATPALELISTKLQEAFTTPDSRLIISMPPQEGKTELTRAAIIQQLTLDPDKRVILGSYNQDLANHGGQQIKAAIESNPQLGIHLARDSHAKAEWALAGARGGMIARGRGAGVSGRAADLLIIDDPFKEGEAESQAARDEAWDWWRMGLATRLSPGAPVIVIMTRWHEDDLVARLLDQDAHAGWQYLNIPAQCENETIDPLGRKLGQYMTSARGRTRQQWEARKLTLGTRAWNALCQGRPAPAEGGIFRREWWRTYTTPRWLTDEHGARWVKDGTLVQSWDLAFKGTDHSDWVVGQIWQTEGANTWLLDQVRGRWSFTQTREQIIELSKKWPQATAKYVEDKANGPAIIDALSATMPGLIPVNPQGGKEARANAVTPLVEAGNVHLPDRSLAPWVEPLLEELAAFPNGAHDDQVDALTQALSQIYLPAHGKTSSGFMNIG